jgi:hypothetical protein
MLARNLAYELAWEIVRDMKALPPLAQLTVPRGTDLVKSRTSPRRFCRLAVAKKNGANRFFAVLLWVHNEQIA